VAWGNTCFLPDRLAQGHPVGEKVFLKSSLQRSTQIFRFRQLKVFRKEKKVNQEFDYANGESKLVVSRILA